MILKSSKNYIFDTLIPTARTKVKFDGTVAVAKIVHNSYHFNQEQEQLIEDKFTARPVRSILPNLRWYKQRRKEWRQGTRNTKTNKSDGTRYASNIYDNLEDDELTSYGNYKSSYILDTGASGHYGDKKTKVRKRRKVRHGIKVGVANGNTMTQIEEGELPFDNIPEEAKDVQLFENMHSPLLSGGKFVKNKCNIIFDTPEAHILTGETKEAVRQVIEEAKRNNSEDILMTVPFDENTLTWRTNFAINTTAPRLISLNIHRIRSKEKLVDYLHRAAGYPM